MSLPFSPYLSQILTKLLEILTSLQGIKISIHICNLCEVILLLFGTIDFSNKKPVTTSLDRSLRVWLWSLNIWNSLDWLRLPVASFWGKKLDLTGLENTGNRTPLSPFFTEQTVSEKLRNTNMDEYAPICMHQVISSLGTMSVRKLHVSMIGFVGRVSNYHSDSLLIEHTHAERVYW